VFVRVTDARPEDDLERCDCRAGELCRQRD
jgi:hypothetical protein